MDPGKSLRLSTLRESCWIWTVPKGCRLENTEGVDKFRIWDAPKSAVQDIPDSVAKILTQDISKWLLYNFKSSKKATLFILRQSNNQNHGSQITLTRKSKQTSMQSDKTIISNLMSTPNIYLWMIHKKKRTSLMLSNTANGQSGQFFAILATESTSISKIW